MISCVELSKVQTASVLVQSLDILIEPDVLASDSGNSLGLELDLVDRVLRYEITPCCTTLDKKFREIIFLDELLELRTLPEVDLYSLCLTVMVYSEPEDL